MTNQIAEFLKVLYLKNTLRYETDFLYVSNKSIRLGLTLLHIPKIIQNYKSEIYLNDRYGQVSIVCWIPQTMGPMRSLLSVHLSLVLWLSSTFFVGVADCFFFLFFKWSHIILTSKKWYLIFCKNFIFACIWGNRGFCIFYRKFCYLFFLKQCEKRISWPIRL